MQRVPQPEDAYGVGSGYYTFLREVEFGIGAHDGDDVEWTEEAMGPWATAGEQYAYARREGCRIRHDAYEKRAFIARMGL